MSIWDRFPNYSREELRILVYLTAEMLFESDEATSQFPPDFLMISPKAAAQELQLLLQTEGKSVTKLDLQRLLETDETSVELCLKILDIIRAYPEMANQISLAYDRRVQSMATPEIMLLTSALVILAMRIRKVSLQKSKMEFEFESAGKAVSSFIIALLGKIKGL